MPDKVVVLKNDSIPTTVRDIKKRLIVEDTGEYSGYEGIVAHGGEQNPRMVSVVSDKYRMVDHQEMMQLALDTIAQEGVTLKETSGCYWGHGKYFKGILMINREYDFGPAPERSLAKQGISANSPWAYAQGVNQKTHDIVFPILQITNSYSGKDSFKMFMGLHRILPKSNIIVRFPKHEFEADMASPHLGDIEAKIKDFLGEIHNYMQRVEEWRSKDAAKAGNQPFTSDDIIGRFEKIFSPLYALKAKNMLEEALTSGQPLTKWLVLQIATYIYNHDITGVKAYRDYNLYNRLF